MRDVATGQETPAHHRRREGLRLRHRQRRLDATATARSCCGRPTRGRSPPSSRTSAASARCTWSTPASATRSCRPGSIRCPATRRHHDRARRHRRATASARCASRCRPTSIAPRSATTCMLRRRLGGRAVGAGRRAAWRSSRPRATTSWPSCASPTRSTGAVRDVLNELVGDVLRIGQRPRSTGATCPASNEVIWFSRAERLGPPLSLRPHDRQAEAPDHQRRRERDAGAARGREGARRSTSAAVGQARPGAIRTSATSTASASTAENLELLTPEDADHDVTLSPDRHASSSTATRRPTRRRSRCCATPATASVLPLEKADISRLRRHRLEAADADHGEGARRQDRSLRPDVQADQLRCHEEVSDHQPHLSRPADRQRRQPQLRGGARRHAGAGGARLRRRADRRDGHAVALEEVPRRVLRRHGRQHAARSGGRR